LKTTADAVLDKESALQPRHSTPIPMLTRSRKGKIVGNFFDEGFFWSEALDAAADAYNGVIPINNSL
jgi:hypothetical protein